MKAPRADPTPPARCTSEPMTGLRGVGGGGGRGAVADERIAEYLRHLIVGSHPMKITLIVLAVSMFPCLACSSIAPEDPELARPPQVYDARPKCPKYCEVHNVECESGTVPLFGGLGQIKPKGVDNYDEAIYPNANTWYWRCVLSKETVALVLYCSECRRVLQQAAPQAD